MEFISKYKSEVLTAVVVVVLCLGFFAAYTTWLPPSDFFVVNPRLKQIRDSLELRAAIKEELELVWKDSIAAHEARYQEAIADTHNTSEINLHYETVTNNNWRLPANDAAALLRSRLDTEDDYRLRFVYDILPGGYSENE